MPEPGNEGMRRRSRKLLRAVGLRLPDGPGTCGGRSTPMIRPDFERVAAFERERIRRTPPDFERSRRIVAALYREALALGVWERPGLRGLEPDFRTADAFNLRRSPRSAR